jgi:hypothetical protein
MVFLDKLVRRAISLIDSPSRSLILRTFAYIAMVCTSSPRQLQIRQVRSKHPGQFSVRRSLVSWSIFIARQQPIPKGSPRPGRDIRDTARSTVRKLHRPMTGTGAFTQKQTSTLTADHVATTHKRSAKKLGTGSLFVCPWMT